MSKWNNIWPPVVTILITIFISLGLGLWARKHNDATRDEEHKIRVEWCREKGYVGYAIKDNDVFHCVDEGGRMHELADPLCPGVRP